MLNVYGLQTELSEAKALLALAEDVIIGLRSGIESPSVRKEGTFGREKDKAGLRELLHGKDEVCKLGSITWHETMNTAFLARAFPSSLLPKPTQSSLPAELLHHIVSLCDRPSISKLCLANTVLREIASPFLYESLSLSLPSQLDVFLAPAASPRFAEQAQTFTLDRAVQVHIHFHHFLSPTASPCVAVLLPRVQHIHFHDHPMQRRPSSYRSRLHVFLPLLLRTDPLTISFTLHQSPGARPFDGLFHVDAVVWASLVAGWRSLQLVVSNGGHAVCVEGEAQDEIYTLIPWQTTQPTSPQFEIDLDGDQLQRMGAMVAGNQWSPFAGFISILKGTLPETDDPGAIRPFPILQVRVPTEQDRVQLQEALDLLEEELRRSVRFVVGRRRLKGIDL